MFHAVNERCDKRNCPASGQVEFVLSWSSERENPYSLIFCKHDGDRLEVALMAKGFTVGRDNRGNLVENRAVGDVHA